MKGLLIFLIAISTSVVTAQGVDSLKLMDDLRELSSDRYEGRKPGTKGSDLAQRFLANRFNNMNLKSYHPNYMQGVLLVEGKMNPKKPDVPSNREQTALVNIVGYIPGKLKEAIVISAHYDHVGVIDNQIYNGADDNASGVAAMLSIAEHFSKIPPQHTLIFVAFDAEELNMKGSMAFLSKPPVLLNEIVLNVNLDLIGTSPEELMYIGGTKYYPKFKSILKSTWAGDRSVRMRFGYDIPRTPENRTFRSDHGVFHLFEIPYIYFGVPEHPNYHQPTDDFENISHSFYYRSVKLILESVIAIDRDYPK